MKKSVMCITVAFVSAFFVGVVSAKSIPTEKDIAEKKGVSAAAKKNKAAVRGAKKIPTDGDSTVTDAGKTLATESRQDHDTAEKIINNLK